MIDSKAVNRTMKEKTQYKHFINLNNFIKPKLKEQKDFNFTEWLELIECFYFTNQAEVKQKFNKEDLKLNKVKFKDYNLNQLNDFNIDVNFQKLLNQIDFINQIKANDFADFIDNLIFETTFNSFIKTLIRFLLFINFNNNLIDFNLTSFLDFIDYEEEKQQRYLKELKKIRNKKKEEYVLLELNKIKYNQDLLIKESKNKLVKQLKTNNKTTIKYKNEVNEEDLLDFL